MLFSIFRLLVLCTLEIYSSISKHIWLLFSLQCNLVANGRQKSHFDASSPCSFRVQIKFDKSPCSVNFNCWNLCLCGRRQWAVMPSRECSKCWRTQKKRIISRCARFFFCVLLFFTRSTEHFHCIVSPSGNTNRQSVNEWIFPLHFFASISLNETKNLSLASIQLLSLAVVCNMYTQNCTQGFWWKFRFVLCAIENGLWIGKRQISSEKTKAKKCRTKNRTKLPSVALFRHVFLLNFYLEQKKIESASNHSRVIRLFFFFRFFHQTTKSIWNYIRKPFSCAAVNSECVLSLTELHELANFILNRVFVIWWRKSNIIMSSLPHIHCVSMCQPLNKWQNNENWFFFYE